MLISYSYGLKIATLSSKKLADGYEGTLKNNYLYNDKELFDDADLNWYDYGFRNYDPQIGRFTQLDPLTDSYPYYTPYQFAGDEPIANVDVDGLEPSNVVNVISKVSKEGGVNITSKVITSGANAGRWSVSWAKEGILFSHVVKSTGFLTQNAIKAGERILNLVSKVGGIGTNLINSASRGDIPQSFGVTKDEEKLALRAYSRAMNELDDAYENGWHRIQMGDPGNLCSSCVEGGEVNYITGQVRSNPTSITPVYPEALFVPLPKLSFAFKWLGKTIFGEAAAKGGSQLVAQGLGSTGRTTAANLTEQLAMKEITSNPVMGNILKLKKGMTDVRWPSANGWQKMSWNNAGVEIHYVGQWQNGVLKAVDDFKFITK